MGASFLKESAMSKDSPVEMSTLLQEIESLKERVSSLERQARGFEVPTEKVDSLFTLMVEKLTDNEICALFRELDKSTLAEAICGLDQKHVGRIRGNLSANAWQLIIDDIHDKRLGHWQSNSARQEILRVVRQHVEMGLIQSEELYMAIEGEDLERRYPPFLPRTDEERARQVNEEAERKIKHEQWLKNLVHVEVIKENKFTRI